MSEQHSPDLEGDLNSLPLDVLRTISNFLDNGSKLKMRLANTRWFNIIKYNDFRLFFRSPTIEVKQIVDRLLTYNWPISITTTKSYPLIPRDDIPSQFARLTNLTSLDVSATNELNFLDWRPLTSCQRLTHLDTSCIDKMESLGCFPWMKVLTFSTSSPNADLELCERLKKHTNLDRLWIEIDDYKKEREIELFSSITDPTKLTWLKIHLSDACNLDYAKVSRLSNSKTLVCTSYDVRVEPFSKPVILFLGSLPSLESLSIRNDYRLGGFENCTKLTHLEICLPKKDAAYWPNLSKLAKLKSFHVLECNSMDLNENLQFMTGLTELTEFNIVSEFKFDKLFEYLPSTMTHLNIYWFGSEKNLNAWPKVIDDIGRLTNLKVLNLEYCEELGKIDCSVFENLTNLEILSSHINNVTMLSQMTKLKELKLPRTVKTKEFPVLPNLEKLIMFDIESFHLPTFGKMTRLTHLESHAHNIYSTCRYLTDLEHLPLKFLKTKALDNSSYSNITTLENLTAFLTIEDDLNGLTGLKNLTSLAARALPYDLIFCLTRLTNLRELELPLELNHLNDTQYLHAKCFPNIQFY